MTSQESAFLHGEANEWYRRNREGFQKRFTIESDPALRILQLYNIRPSRALEVGACNGFRMHMLQQLTGCHAAAIDPSSQVIEDGRQNYPGVEFHVGTAASLPFPVASFDCVFFFGVFCWIDRSQLFQAAAEVDRVLSDGGYLVIADFLPLCPHRVLYHHKPEAGIYTYKMDHSQLFLSSQLYSLLTTQVVDHSDFVPCVSSLPHDRFSISLLRKESIANFPTRNRPDE